MAKAVKYRIEFTNVENIICRADFYYEGYVGDVIELEFGARPFVLREFNSDDDIFKPIRAFMAEMEVVTNVNGVQIEDFYAEQDTDIEVRFLYNNEPYWRGYILQDDFQEVWDDSNHILIIRAADGFGLLNGFEFKDGDTELNGKYTPWEMLGIAMNRLPRTPLNDYYLINNLYHRSMSETSGGINLSPLTQCYIDAKTFQIESTKYESCYTAIEKINRAFNQTVFMYKGSWCFLRVEELYTSYNNNFRGVQVVGGASYNIDGRFDIEVGINESIKPITPEMLKLISKKTKYDKVRFSYEPFNEMLLNETFARGALVSTVGNSKLYNVNDWTFTAPGSGYDYKAREIYMSSTAGGLLERYIFMEYTGSATTEATLLSSNFPVEITNILKFTIDVKQLNVGSTEALRNQKIAYIIIESGGLFAWLNEVGDWTIETDINDCQALRLNCNEDNVQQDEWNTVQVQSGLMPFAGNISCKLVLTTDAAYPNSITYYKNLEFKVLTSFESGEDVRRITGIESKFEKDGTIVKTSNQTIYLDDHFSTVHKGAIFESDEVTLTDSDWYRYRYPSESFGFRRQNDTAYWEHNKFNRNRIDCNFFGTYFNNGVSVLPIGLLSTFRFIDDDVNKVYWIANLSEINFANSTWSATLEEVFDETLDVDTTETFEANFTLQTYVITLPYTFTVPLTLVTAGGFSIQSGNSARYDGLPTLSTPIECSIFGTMSAPSYPSSVTFQLQQNGTSIKSVTLPIYYANFPYTLNLSAGITSIATNDNFKVVVSGASNLVVGGGDMKINTPSTTQDYDTYTDNYIFE